MTVEPTSEHHVLIVGAGPAGLTAALLLGRRGIPTLVVDRRDGPQRHPAAHVVNARTLEIFRQAGVDMEAIAAVSMSPTEGGHVNFTTRLNGELIGRLPFEQQGDEVLAITPTPLRNIAQHRLEPILLDAVRQQPSVEVRYSTTWVSADVDDEGVASTLRDDATGQSVEIRSTYLLGADGAASRVRQMIGVEMDGIPAIQSFVSAHFEANLSGVLADRPGVLHWTLDPAANGTFVGHGADEWVFMKGFDPTVESADDHPEERCRGYIVDAIGDPDIEVDIRGIGTWHMTAQVARAFRSGRIFLLGDAAHRFPPTGGLGLNSGVGDAHNLVWKLVSVMNGDAGASLLDTYEQERRPVAEVNCAQSTTNAMQIVVLLQALGLTGGSSTEALLETIADPDRADEIADGLEAQRVHFDMLGLQLGYGYASAAIDAVDVARDVEHPSVLVDDGALGTRLPHAWLPDGRSTLDLAADDSWTLISVGAHNRWAASVVPGLRHAAVDDDEWRRRLGLTADAAVLVRPDQHIAWRAASASADQLADVLARLSMR